MRQPGLTTPAPATSARRRLRRHGLLGLGLGALAFLPMLSCHGRGACEGVEGSCLALTVDGDGGFDRLRTKLELLPAGTPSRIGDTDQLLPLPQTIRVVPPSGVSSSQITGIEVLGRTEDRDVARGHTAADFSWPDGAHIEASVRLVAIADSPADMGEGGSDAAMPPADLAKPADLSQPPADMGPAPTLRWRNETVNGVRQPLYDVWAGGGVVVAVGSGGTSILRQGDSTWKAEMTGTTVALNGISGFAGTSAWAVGAAPGAFRRAAAGGYTADSGGLNLGAQLELLSVTSGATAGELWAGGKSGGVFRRTGSAAAAGTWQGPEQALPGGQQVNGIASAGGAIFAVGDNGNVAVRKDGMAGTAWQTYKFGDVMGQPIKFTAVWAFDRDNAVAVGSNGRLARYSSGSWQATTLEIDTGRRELNGVWGTAPDRLWAVGYNGLIVRVDGTRSTQLNLSMPDSLYAIYGLSDADIYVVGEGPGGSSLVLHGQP